MDFRKARILSAVLLAFIASGCAATPQYLTREQASAIKKVAVVAEMKEKEWTVLDHTNVWQKSYTGGQFGLIGGLVDAAVLATEQSIKQEKSLGGDVELLRKEIQSVEVTDMIHADLRNRLAKTCEVINTSAQAGQNAPQPPASPTQMADAVLKLQIKYGLAVYADKMANAAVDADIEVSDAHTGDVLMKKKVQSDTLYSDHHSIDKFAAEGGQLFKQNMAKAVAALAEQVANEFGAAK